MDGTKPVRRVFASRFARKTVGHIILVAVFMGILSSCVSSDGSSLSADFTPGGPEGGSRHAVIGGSCLSATDPSRICLGVKYLVYVDPAGAPIAGASVALTNLNLINRIWSQCDIQVEIEEFVEANPLSQGLAFHPSNLSDMDSIRTAYEEDDHLLIVTTGSWDRSGTLGESSANAWTALPGTGPDGSIIDGGVAAYGNIFAHELGHYFNLYHVSDASNLMNPVIYTTSTALTSSQCATARSAATEFFGPMARIPR